MIGRSLYAAAKLRARVGKATPPREELIAEHVAGRSFVDVGCMWTIHGALCFAAEDAGAASVTGVDVMAPSPQFVAERERRGSRVRFVRGDLHLPRRSPRSAATTSSGARASSTTRRTRC